MPRKQQLNDILEICLTLVFSGHETIDSALAQYPEYADELRPMLESALWLHNQKSLVGARPGYVKASRKRIVDQIKAEDINPVLPKQLFPFLDRAVLRLVFLTLFLFISLLSIQRGAQVINSSLPGDTVYPLKVTYENMELLLVSDSSAEAELYIKFANERAREIEELLDQGNFENIENSFEQYSENLVKAGDLITNMRGDPVRKAVLAQTLTLSVSQHNQVFSSFTKAEIPSQIIVSVNTTLSSNDKITSIMLVVLEESGDEGLPVEFLMAASATFASGKPGSTTTAKPDEFSDPTKTQKPTNTPKPTHTSKPTKTTKPSNTPKHTDKLEPTKTSKPSNTPQPTHTSKPTKTTKPSNTPKPTKTSKPTNTKKPTKTEKPTNLPKPTKTDKPTKTPKK
jgi:hypothetical protein